MRTLFIIAGLICLFAAVPIHFFLDRNLTYSEPGLGPDAIGVVNEVAMALGTPAMRELSAVLRESEVPGEFEELRETIFEVAMPAGNPDMSNWSEFERETFRLQKERWAEVLSARRIWLERKDAAPRELLSAYRETLGGFQSSGMIVDRIRERTESAVRDGMLSVRESGLENVNWDDVVSARIGDRGRLSSTSTVRLLGAACADLRQAASAVEGSSSVVNCLDALSQAELASERIEAGLGTLGPWAQDRSNRSFVARLNRRLSDLRGELANMEITTVRTLNGVRTSSTTVDAVVHWKSDLEWISSRITAFDQTVIPWVFLEGEYGEVLARFDKVDSEVARIPTGGFGRYPF